MDIALPHNDPPLTLCGLGEDVLKHILSHCSAVALCNLERTCSTFVRPAATVYGDGLRLSLAERVAQAAVARAQGSGVARSYERGADESFKRVLWLLDEGLLAHGVLHDVPVGALKSKASGWTLAFSHPYSQRTRDCDLDLIPQHARYVLVAAFGATGARSTDVHVGGVVVNSPRPEAEEAKRAIDCARKPSGAFEDALVFPLCAWARRETVLKVTHTNGSHFRGGKTTSDNVEAGVYWYRWPAHAMGFSSDPELFLLYADAWIFFRRKFVGDDRPDEAFPKERASGDRISWNLDAGESTGGWRAGEAYELGDSNEWLKQIYYRV